MRKLYVVAGIVALLVVLVVAVFAIYSANPAMVHQACTRLLFGNWEACSAVFPL